MTTAIRSCPHHWVCDPVKGEKSTAICQLCGEQREFQNYLRPEEAESLPYETDSAYLPEKKQIARLEVTDEPEPEEKPKPAKGCQHSWAAGDPDGRGISHVRCSLCPQEYWVDAEGLLYDADGGLSRNQSVRRGEFGLSILAREGRKKMPPLQPVPRQPDGKAQSPQESIKWYTQHWSEIIRRLEELKHIGPVDQELGVSYSALAGTLVRRGVDITKYQGGRGRRGIKRQPREQEPPAATPVPTLNELVNEVRGLEEMVKHLARAIDSLTAPRCRLAWEGSRPVFLCETEADGRRLQAMLDRKEVVVKWEYGK